MKYYTGVGSRSTPVWCRFAMEDIADRLAQKSYTLRSGSAQGADSAFEYGLQFEKGKADIYIPWKGFGVGSSRDNIKYHVLTDEEFYQARDVYLVTGIIPHFDKMKQGAQKLHARNLLQVLGHKIKIEPSKVCIYYAEVDWITGEPEGGTRSAVMLARHFNIPTYNLKDDKDFEKVSKILELNSKDWYKEYQDKRLELESTKKF